MITDNIDSMSLPMEENPSIDELLTMSVEAGGSDLHLSTGSYPKYRVDGDLQNVPGTLPIEAKWLFAQFENIATSQAKQSYKTIKEADFSHEVRGIARFRVNFFVQQNTPAAVLRTIPEVIKTIEELGLPEALNEITHKPKGLILVTGPTGSGKSTTMAAMIESRNRIYPEHIMTIEDPVEFTYTSKKALINQREVSRDTTSFNEALKRVLRQDPDVILIGELRDPETISIALTAAETGHLVIGTLHTQSAAKSINRIIDSFPAHQQSQVRTQLSDTLQAVISQSLLKKIGGGRVAATEIMVRTTAVANQIREGMTSQLVSSIQTGQSVGMHTLDQDLKRLVQSGLVSKDEAEIYLENKDTLKGVSALR